MKTFRRLIIWLFIAVAAASVMVVMHVRKAEAQKMESDSQAAESSAKNAVTEAVNAGTQAAHEVASNVVTATQEGMWKADQLATNVAARAKVITTNVVSKVARVTTNVLDQAQQKFDVITH